MNFLKPNDPGAFVDYPEISEPPKWSKDWVECPVCYKHGGWNLTVNSRTLPKGVEDNSENRHKYAHFRACCNQCNGYGWTSAENAKCIHEMAFSRNLGRCYNEYKCTKCGTITNIDSSD